MRTSAWMSVLTVAAAVLALGRCVGDTPAPGGDASTDQTTSDAPALDSAPDAPPAQGFSVSLQPTHVTFDDGDPAATVQIAITRASGFTDDISFALTPPPGITASAALDTGTGGDSSSFSVSLDADAGPGVTGELNPLTVTASNPSKSFVVNAHLGIRVGSLLEISDGGVAIPSYASSVIIKAWGAGGGASCKTCSGTGGPAQGGAGGFASAVVSVTPGSTLVAIAGTGGSAGGGGASADGGCGGSVGGSGGGFSAVEDQGKAYLVIAGAGGGAAYYETGAGAGGGATGQDDQSLCGGLGGTQTQGGGSTDAGCSLVGTPGAAYQGGNGAKGSTCILTLTVDGGVPGGGNGGIGSYNIGLGGGGGGYFGGGGGGEGVISSQAYFGGGGGGSGWFAGDAGKLVTGNLASVANTTDPDYALCPSGAAAGGTPGTNNGAGGPGCIIVRLPKP